MASHVPFLALRPDEQFSTQVAENDTSDTNRVSISTMANNLAQRLPSSLRFPIAVLVALSLSSLLYSLASGLTGHELAAVSRNLTSEWHIGAMLAWKLAELYIAWYACYDYVDLAYLTLLNQVPHYFLLNTFFGIDLVAVLIPLAIDVTSVAIPFALLRGVNAGHADSTVKTPNQLIAQDLPVRLLTATFGASVYALVMYLGFQTRLTLWMVTYFDGIRDLQRAHDTEVWALLALFAPLGFAATQFIFVPAIGSPGNPGLDIVSPVPQRRFDPKTATLSETIARNLGRQEGFSRRTEILAKRTLTLAACCFVNTFVRSYVTIEGTELIGALLYSGVWSTAALASGLAFGYVSWE
ncbi:uncharacterized protein RCC_04466 [Lecanosticta acicola]|uniref:Uncharacterized protein RCC_04466 n=1 Tax=Lecanosticta acicola TaxID=111012 RepID=A0AAI9EDS7_9PEZI|nr:uncharacterized protein RCC_04466 [Lecanosticta acicola]